MGRAFATVVAFTVSGCAQLFGIDSTSSPAADALPTVASLEVQRVSIGTSIVRAPQDLSAATATFLIANSDAPGGFDRVPATLGGTPNTWSAEVPAGSAPAVEFTLPDVANGYRRFYALPNLTLRTAFTVLEDPSDEPAPAGAAIALGVTLPSGYASTESFQLYSVGSWANHGLTAAELPAPDMSLTTIAATIPYNATTFGSISGRPLSGISADDQLLVLRYIGNQLTGSAEVTPFAQTGGTDTVNVVLAANPMAPLDVHVQPTTVGQRLANTKPTVGGLSMAWSVNAAPGYAIVSNTGVQLQYGGVLATDTGAITASYGNPFTAHGWNTIFTFASGETRTYMDPASMLPMTLSAGLQQYAEPAAGLTLDLPTGLPVLISINQLPLGSDGMTVVLDPTKSVELTMVPDKTTNTFYQFTVYELVPNTAMPPTALGYSVAYAVSTATPTVKIPGDALVAGHTYTIRAVCINGGYPMFASGDLLNRELPQSVGYLDSGVFTVAAPI